MKQDSNKPAASVRKFSRKARLAALAAAIVLGAGAIFYFSTRITTQASMKEGRTYLKERAEHPVDEVIAKLNERDAQEAEAKEQELINGVRSGSISIWPLFKDSVIIGDSRARGFGDYGDLPDSQVLAVIGSNITDIPDLQGQIEAIKPKVIYVSYGMNDVENKIGSDQGEDGFGKLYEENLKKLLEKSPNSKIVVNAIIPPSAAVRASDPLWEAVDDYNRQIKEMCERNGWTYIDNTDLAEGGNAPIYEPDGIHFIASFYPTWGQSLLSSQYGNIAN